MVDGWELVRGLKLAMDDFDIDLVRCMREPKEIKSWTLADLYTTYQEPHPHPTLHA
jgi:hypothetical protein